MVFCRADDAGIRQLADLRGKRVAATDPRTLGGALSVFRELRALGIRP
ncbi:MAG: hypothetical protein HY822_24785 [Acidobacteria bacterium]|nr:hypothetical protein [Acidobacteriota bacterium]